MQYPMNDDVTKALQALGSTADEVAQNLEKGGFKGKRGWPRECPIARYLESEVFSKHEGVYDVYTYSMSTHVDKTDAHDRNVETVAVALHPDAVAIFADRFDMGDYPHLVEER